MNFKQVTKLMHLDMSELDNLLTTRLSSDVALINQISHYIINSGGKRIRPLIVLLLCNAMNNKNSHKYTMATTIELIHTATLLHDDVVDESSTRRSNNTANANWGNSVAILTGDFLYSRAFEMMVEPNSMQIMQIMAESTNKIAEGEVLQLLNCGKIDLSEAEYFATIEKKTAVLFEAASKVAGVLSGNDELKKLASFGINLGNAFQIIDDILDYKSSNSAMGKEVGDDLTEGKVTLPLIWALKNASHNDKKSLMTAINEKDTSNIAEIIRIVEDNKGFEYAMNKARECSKIAKKNIEFLENSDYKKALISLCDLSLDRKS